MTRYTCDKCGRQVPEMELFNLTLTPRLILSQPVANLRKEICNRCAAIILDLLADALPETSMRSLSNTTPDGRAA